MSKITFGRRLTDQELALFHGGKCTITITTEGEVKKSGNCEGVTVEQE